MKKRFEKLEKLISELEISNSELIEWVNTRVKNDLIPTALPLVYRQGQVFTIESGLNPNRRNELWGIQLCSGIMIALKCGPENNVPSISWGNVKKFAKQMVFNGKQGSLPHPNVLKKNWESNKEALIATTNVLNDNNINADSCIGCIWCIEDYGPTNASFFNLDSAYISWAPKVSRSKFKRIAVSFAEIDTASNPIIPTDLPLVYRQGKVLTIEPGLILNRRNELWGIQLTSGAMVALKCGPGTNVTSTIWDKIKKFAQSMTFNGQHGSLPVKEVLKEHWGGKEKEAFEATVDVLKSNNIDADGYFGCLWCAEPKTDHAHFFNLNFGTCGWINKKETYYSDRVILTFD